MTPTEFVLWLNGAMGVMGDTPTPEQMVKIREQLGEVIGKITADRLLERAEEQARKDSKVSQAHVMLRDLQYYDALQRSAGAASQTMKIR